MPTYEHGCTCGFEWEEEYSIKADPPTLCPECKKEGGVTRFISGGSGRGIIILAGHDLNAHLKSEGKKLHSLAMKDENVRANLIGEEKYHNQLLESNKIMDDLVSIGRDAPTHKQQKELSKSKKKGSFRRTDSKK